jgi:RimJ/RimL family protein N-acetyltransferase
MHMTTEKAETGAVPRFDMQPTLEGELLRVRPLRPDDFEALYAVASDPLIWAQHPDSNRYQREVFLEFFRKAIEGRGALAVFDVATDEMIGSSRYHGYDPARSEVEIGWTFLARQYWGGRHNGELKRLMFDHAFRFVDQVVLIIGETNWRSRRAAEKVGGVLEGGRVNAEGEVRLAYVVTKADWRAGGQAGGK